MALAVPADALAVYENENVADGLIDLFEQWQKDEDGDWAGYTAALSRIVTDAEAKFVKATKRPFGCHITVGDQNYSLTVSRQSYSITSL